MAAGFPLEVPLDFVFDDDAPGPFVVLPDGELERIVSHCEDGKALLLDQFRRPRIEAMLCALLEHVQEFDDAAWRVLTERVIDEAIGAQLDGLGSIVGQPRQGLEDEDYRAVIRGRVAANRSDGGTEAIYDIVVAALSYPDGAIAKLRRYGTGAFVLRLFVPVSFDEGVINGLIQDGKSAGVRAQVVVPMVAPGGSIRFSAAADFRTLRAASGFDSAATPGTGTGSLARAMDEGI